MAPRWISDRLAKLMLSAWRQSCAAPGRHTALSLRCKAGRREAERPGAMFVVVLARGTSRGIILTVFFTRRPSCGPAAWRYFTRLVQSDQTWAYKNNQIQQADIAFQDPGLTKIVKFSRLTLQNMWVPESWPYENSQIQQADITKHVGSRILAWQK